jgi:hypothetical protein
MSGLEDKGDATRETMLTKKDVIATEYWKVGKNSLNQLLDSAPKAWKGVHAADYEYELKVAKSLTLPFAYGAVASIVTFVSFRLGQNPAVQRYRETIKNRYFPTIFQNPNNFTIKEKATTHQKFKEWKSYSERLVEERSSKVDDSFQMIQDIMLSIAVGMSIIGLTTDVTRLQTALEVFPLLPGQSAVAKQVCPDMIQLYNRVDPSVWENLGKKDDTLKSLQAIVKHCHLRENAKRRIILSNDGQMEDNDDDDVVIPYPGISFSD